MKRQAKLGMLLALAAAAPAIVAPKLSAPAHAQDRAEYPDVPRGHWAYEALDRLSRAGIVEGRPGGVYEGNRPMTRYEFAVAIARLLDRIPGQQPVPVVTTTPPTPLPGDLVRRGDLPDFNTFATDQELADAIAALRTEFADELARLGVRVDALEGRVAGLENRVTAPPRLTVTPSILHRFGTATYIDQQAGGLGFVGRNIFTGNDVVNAAPAQPRTRPFDNEGFVDGKYSYTDFELRLTDRVTDRLSVNAALRSISGTQEDPWAGQFFNQGFGYIREANVVANLGDRSFLGVRGLNLIVGRQRTKIGQGLLYDNDLQPTDQLHGQFNIGPVQLNAFLGTNNNVDSSQGQVPNIADGHPYLNQGAVAFFGLSGGDILPGGNGFQATAPFFPGANADDADRRASGAAVGFPSAGGTTGGGSVFPDDNESLIRAGFNLFRISGNPVSIGITRQFDGVMNQRGDALDLTIPLFNRTVGIEYVRQRQYANGLDAPDNPSAYNITVPVLRARVLDLDFAYGTADDDFEYFISSSANPFARTYAEALFDRPLALGAPMISNTLQGPTYAAAKKVFDFSGTLRILRRLPLDFRYYRAYGSALAPGGQENRLDLGQVFTVGSTFNISPGLDLEVKYGQYRIGSDNNQSGFNGPIRYVRVGANVGF